MSYISTYQNEFLMSGAAAGAENESAAAAAAAAPAAAVRYAEKSDAEIVELVLSGDEAAFEQFFDRYKRLVAATAARYFRRPEQIDEIIQVSFAKAFFELKRFRGGHEFSLAGWVGKITTNACLDALKSRRRKPENLLCELSAFKGDTLFSEGGLREGTDAEEALVSRDLAEKLLSQLEAEDRAVLQMLDAEEMSVGEVAQLTGWTKSKVKIRAHRARKALRKVLQKFL